MNEPLMDTAYSLARQHCDTARLAVFSGLDSQFSGEGFDTVHHAAERAMDLHLAALGFARKVWCGNLPSEKAVELLRTQFSDFPASTCQRAFSDACIERR
jgi:hypothetical protein